MKVTIDFENKTVSVNDGINISDLVNKLKIALPEDWTEYTLIPEPLLYNPTDWYKPYPGVFGNPVMYDTNDAIHLSKYKVGDKFIDNVNKSFIELSPTDKIKRMDQVYKNIDWSLEND